MAQAVSTKIVSAQEMADFINGLANKYDDVLDTVQAENGQFLIIYKPQ